jgi:hypothetical protein
VAPEPFTSTPAFYGIIAAAVVLLICIIVVIACVISRRKKGNDKHSSRQPMRDISTRTLAAAPTDDQPQRLEVIWVENAEDLSSSSSN